MGQETGAAQGRVMSKRTLLVTRGDSLSLGWKEAGIPKVPGPAQRGPGPGLVRGVFRVGSLRRNHLAGLPFGEVHLGVYLAGVG